jgi:hypothetical protein
LVRPTRLVMLFSTRNFLLHLGQARRAAKVVPIRAEDETCATVRTNDAVLVEGF